jgi:hypothetical protein
MSTDEFDAVTEDAIRDKAPIPPMDWPQDQRRAYLGGIYSFRNGTERTACPYIDHDCATAWYRGYDRERKSMT